jgi:hypothetical protein
VSQDEVIRSPHLKVQLSEHRKNHFHGLCRLHKHQPPTKETLRTRAHIEKEDKTDQSLTSPVSLANENILFEASFSPFAEVTPSTMKAFGKYSH